MRAVYAAVGRNMQQRPSNFNHPNMTIDRRGFLAAPSLAVVF